MSKLADLLIVGGGPGGLTLAILARQMGLNAGLIEAVKYPHEAHGDTFTSGVAAYFKMLGIPEERLYRDAVPFRSHNLRWENEAEQAYSQIPSEGLHLPRHLLEPMLMERAREIGASVLQPCVVKSLIMNENRLAGVDTDKGKFFARFVVDAAGSRHWLARKLGMAVEFYSPKLYGYYNWARGNCPACYERPLIYSDPQGWSWISRVEPELYQFTRMTFEPQENFRGWQPPEFVESGLEPIGPTRGADMTWRVVQRPAGQAFFMIGDALRRTDPMTSRGIERAMVDAFKVALLLTKWKDNELSEEELITAYVEDIAQDYRKGLENSYGFLRTHPNAPDWLKGDHLYFREAYLHQARSNEATTSGVSKCA